MRKARVLVVLGVILGVLLFGATAAQGAWWWNAKWEVEGQVVRTKWVVDGITDPADYFANITFTLPEKAKVLLLEEGPYEDVTLARSADLKCTSEGVEATVSYVVNPKALLGLLGGGSDDAKVNVSVVEINTQIEQVLGQATGKVKKAVKVDLLIPASGAAC